MDVMFSIIIPIFNVESFLDECISSVLSQTYKNFEILLIDDGSNDGSPLKCDKYCEKYENCYVVHKKNAGLGFARNSGIKMSHGKYLVFLDSDDFLMDNDFLLKMSKIILENTPDIISYYHSDFDDVTKVFTRIKINKKNNGVIKNVKLGNYLVSAWSKVVNKEFLINNQCFFEKGISEDFLWNAKLLANNPSIFFYLDSPIYAYRKNRAGSITNKNSSEYVDTWIHILDSINKINSNSIAVSYYSAIVYFMLFMESSKIMSKKEIMKKGEQFGQTKDLLKRPPNLKILVLRVMINLIGVKNSMFLIRRFKGKGKYD